MKLINNIHSQSYPNDIWFNDLGNGRKLQGHNVEFYYSRMIKTKGKYSNHFKIGKWLENYNYKEFSSFNYIEYKYYL